VLRLELYQGFRPAQFLARKIEFKGPEAQETMPLAAIRPWGRHAVHYDTRGRKLRRLRNFKIRRNLAANMRLSEN